MDLEAAFAKVEEPKCEGGTLWIFSLRGGVILMGLVGPHPFRTLPLLMANSIQVDALAQLLIEEGLISEQEFFSKLKQVQLQYEDHGVKS